MVRLARQHALALFCSFALPATSAAQGQIASRDPVRIERLAALGKLWGLVKLFHPAFLSGRIDWDSALVAVIPEVRAARSATEYASAVDGMLAALRDPATHVVRKPPVAPPTNLAQQARSRWVSDSILVLTISDYEDFESVLATLQGSGSEIPKARGVIFDLRAETAASETGILSFVFAESGVNTLLSPMPVVAPSQRLRMHSGLPPQSGGSTGGYYSAT